MLCFADLLVDGVCGVIAFGLTFPVGLSMCEFCLGGVAGLVVMLFWRFLLVLLCLRTWFG